MLVVRRIEIGDVGGEQLGGFGCFELVGRAGLVCWMGEDVGDAELDVLVGAGCPCFEVGHLHACGRIHPVGGFDQTREDNGFEFWRE